MSGFKAPRSLRGFNVVERPGATQAVAGLGLAATICVASVGPAGAQTQLPTVTMEAPAAPKVQPRRPVRRAEGTPRAATPRPGASPATSAAPSQPAGGAPVAANASPFANPGAPFKVERSANSRLTEPLLNTPRSVTAVPKEVLEDKGATSVRELTRTTPGLTLGTGEGGNAFGDRVFIRGFDARNDMYINGVRESGVSTRETFMAEQVEIIKGPAGSISGRGTAGGAINIVTKQPGPVNFANFDTVVGTDMTRRQTADVNYNISKDFAVRVNGMAQYADVPGRDHVFDNRYGGSIAATWRSTERFKATFDYYGVSLDQLPDWGVSFDPRTRKPFTESGIDRDRYYGVTARDFQKNSQHMFTQGLEYSFNPNLTLANRFRYSETVTDYVASKPGTPDLTNRNPALWSVNLTPASRYQVNRSFANITEATAKFDTGLLKHTVIAGMELQREDISQDGYSGLAVECAPACNTGLLTNLWTPTGHLAGVAQSPTLTRRPTLTKVDTASFYALDTINWNDRLFINAGIRADDYSITREPFGGAQLSRSDLMVNWNAGITYKVMPNASLYAAYSTSSNPVGSELDGGGEDYGSLTAANQVFRPEKNTAIEAGAKVELFEKRLLATAALFQTTKDNARETINGVLQDSAAYRVQGVEFGLTGNITERLSVFGGAVFMDSKVTKSASVASATQLSILGRPLANIAHQSFNLLAKYRLTDHFMIGGQATWKGEILGGNVGAFSYLPGTVNVGGVQVPTPGGYNKLPGGWRFDVMAEYEVSKNFTVKAQVQNIFDKVLYDAFYRSNTPYVYIAPGRVAYLTLQAKF